VLEGEGNPVADVLAEPGIDRHGIAAAEHQVDPPLGKVLEHRVILGHLHRVVGGDQRHRRAENDVLCARRDVGEQRRRRGGEERRVVVLADGEDVEPHLIRALGDANDRIDPLRFARRDAREGITRHVADRENSELHLAYFQLVHALQCMRMHITTAFGPGSGVWRNSALLNAQR
jgi:hypothetical protein